MKFETSRNHQLGRVVHIARPLRTLEAYFHQRHTAIVNQTGSCLRAYVIKRHVEATLGGEQTDSILAEMNSGTVLEPSLMSSCVSNIGIDVTNMLIACSMPARHIDVASALKKSTLEDLSWTN